MSIPDLTIAIISTDTLELLLPCLASVYEHTHDTTLEIYVVDNASSEAIGETVKLEFPDVKLIRNETRLGFSTNNNMVLERGSGSYLMLLNDDTLVLDGALDRLVAFMDDHPEAGAVGGYLLNEDGSFQPCFAGFPNPLVEGVLPVGFWYYRTVSQIDTPIEVDSVCGAAMLVRRETMEEVGILDTDFDPIYSEEIDWCYRIKKSGWKIYTLPEAQFIHYGGQTMNRVVPRKYELLLSHRVLFFRKHRGSIAVAIYKASLYLTTLVKMLLWTLIEVARSNSATAKEKRDLHSYLLKRIPSF